MLLKPGQVKDPGTNILLIPQIEVIGFIFTVADDEQFHGTKRGSTALDENDAKKSKLDDEYSEEMQCGICIDLMYQAVTVMPCLHSVKSAYISYI